MDIREQLKNMSAEDRRSLRKEIIEACIVGQFEPPIPDAPYISVMFCKWRNGWIPFTGYGCDLDTKTTVEFIEQIGKAVDVLNKKGGKK